MYMALEESHIVNLRVSHVVVVECMKRSTA